ncbi:MAG TPA: hypothetical protein VL500_00035 [Candidatus Eisenbacteria bacterium]|jgi:hypothetical protein|nr:hypothetical protein [Candidatus Eisenbacteria bacterium]
MSGLRLFSLGCALFCAFLPTHARADGLWEPNVDVVTTTGLFGYRPSTVLSHDGDGTFIAANTPRMRTEVRGRMRITGSWLEFDLEPYTVIPDDRLKVSLGGVEATLVAPIRPWLKVGLYHHSAHNFSDADYGWGIDLNAVVLDLRILHGQATFLDGTGEYRLRFLGHGYYRDQASAYVLTSTSSVAAADIGGTAWRAGLLFDGDHPAGRTECSALVASDGAAPSSLTVNLSLTAKLGGDFFGTLGEHLYAGPFIGYGQNFSRTAEFGSNTFYGGIRVDLVFTAPPKPHAKGG